MIAATLHLVLFVCLSSLAMPSHAQDTKLQVLDHYQGIWDCQFTLSPQQESDEAKTFTGFVEGKWVVGNKFLEQTGSYRLSESSSPIVIRTMMSFDEKQQRYQYDYFNSTGDIQRSFGTWDEEAKTMTSTMTDKNSGNVTTIRADFSTADSEHWTIETKDTNGKLIMKIVGTNTKRASK